MQTVNRHRAKVLAGAALAAGVALVYFVGSSDRSSSASAISRYETECRKWVAAEFSDSREATLTRSKVQDGVYVFDFFAPDKPGSSQGKSVLCLANPETGMLSRPGAFERSKWY